MKNLKLTYILALFSVLFYTSCETTELEITSDPNFLSPEDANVDLFLNGFKKISHDLFKDLEILGLN